jgi:hypothetical protein
MATMATRNTSLRRSPTIRLPSIGLYGVSSYHITLATSLLTPGRKGTHSGFAWETVGAKPIIWVARGKHANYPSQQACNDGNGGGYLVDLVFSYDTFNGNDSFFYLSNMGATRNIGSSQIRLINCLSSQNTFGDKDHRYAGFYAGVGVGAAATILSVLWCSDRDHDCSVSRPLLLGPIMTGVLGLTGALVGGLFPKHRTEGAATN